VETVIARIFFTVNTMQNHRISLKEMRRSNLVEMFNDVDEETDINEVCTHGSVITHFSKVVCVD
jgi:serine/threonine-protein phosphatase 2A regulatory subunit B''